mgnify:CR=1 FL=1
MPTILEDLQEYQKLMEFRGSFFTQHREQNFSTGMFEIATRTRLYIQMMASAYIEETDMPASECELVVKYNPFTLETSFSFRKRTP